MALEVEKQTCHQEIEGADLLPIEETRVVGDGEIGIEEMMEAAGEREADRQVMRQWRWAGVRRKGPEEVLEMGSWGEGKE